MTSFTQDVDCILSPPLKRQKTSGNRFTFLSTSATQKHCFDQLGLTAVPTVNALEDSEEDEDEIVHCALKSTHSSNEDDDTEDEIVDLDLKSTHSSDEDDDVEHEDDEMVDLDVKSTVSSDKDDDKQDKDEMVDFDLRSSTLSYSEDDEQDSECMLPSNPTKQTVIRSFQTQYLDQPGITPSPILDVAIRGDANDELLLKTPKVIVTRKEPNDKPLTRLKQPYVNAPDLLEDDSQDIEMEHYELKGSLSSEDDIAGSQPLYLVDYSTREHPFVVVDNNQYWRMNSNKNKQYFYCSWSSYKNGKRWKCKGAVHGIVTDGILMLSYLKPCSIDHEPNWTVKHAQKALQMMQLNLSMVCGKKPHDIFDKNAMKNPSKIIELKLHYNRVKRNLYNHRMNQNVKLAKTTEDAIREIEKKGLLDSKWDQMVKGIKDRSENEYVSDCLAYYPKQLVPNHPDIDLHEHDTQLYGLLYGKTAINLRINWLNGQRLHDKVTKDWFGSLLIGKTSKNYLVIQPNYVKRMLQSGLVKRVLLDGTFVKVFGADGKVIYNMELFWSGLIKAPSLEYVSKLIPMGCCMTKSKAKGTYQEIADLVRDHDGMAHLWKDVEELSVDLEWSLGNEFKDRLLVSSKILYCFFHTEQRWFGKLNKLGLKPNYKNNLNFKMEINHLFYILFLPDELIPQFHHDQSRKVLESSTIKNQVKVLLRYHNDNYTHPTNAKFHVKKWGLYYRILKSTLTRLDLTNNLEEIYNKLFKQRCGKHPNYRIMCDALIDVYAKGAMEFEMVHEASLQTQQEYKKCFNRKRKSRIATDKELLNVMKRFHKEWTEQRNKEYDYQFCRQYLTRVLAIVKPYLFTAEDIVDALTPEISDEESSDEELELLVEQELLEMANNINEEGDDEVEFWTLDNRRFHEKRKEYTKTYDLAKSDELMNQLIKIIRADSDYKEIVHNKLNEDGFLLESTPYPLLNVSLFNVPEGSVLAYYDDNSGEWEIAVLLYVEKVTTINAMFLLPEALPNTSKELWVEWAKLTRKNQRFRVL